MRIDILTLFPKMFEGPFNESIIKRAQKSNLVEIYLHNLRKWATDRYKTVDDHPYGGGAGMILKVDVVDAALKALATINCSSPTKVVLLDAGGRKFNEKKALQLSKVDHLVFIAGHYEGVDYRVHQYLANEILSIGDYILTGGEIPTMVVVDATIRLIPGVLKKSEAIKSESFSKENCLEYPQYTRPENYKGWKVPPILLSGNHAEIEKWRKQKAIKRTIKLRPDLIKK